MNAKHTETEIKGNIWRDKQRKSTIKREQKKQKNNERQRETMRAGPSTRPMFWVMLTNYGTRFRTFPRLWLP